jgi:hypothetical protein
MKAACGPGRLPSSGGDSGCGFGAVAACGRRPGRPPTWARRQLIDGIRRRIRVGAPWKPSTGSAPYPTEPHDPSVTPQSKARRKPRLPVEVVGDLRGHRVAPVSVPIGAWPLRAPPRRPGNGQPPRAHRCRTGPRKRAGTGSRRRPRGRPNRHCPSGKCRRRAGRRKGSPAPVVSRVCASLPRIRHFRPLIRRPLSHLRGEEGSHSSGARRSRGDNSRLPTVHCGGLCTERTAPRARSNAPGDGKSGHSPVIDHGG